MSERVPDEVLGAWGFEGARLSQFERGLINTHWLAERGEERVVFRRYNAVRTRETALWEQDLAAFAASRGWPTAPTLPSNRGERLVEHGGRLWSALPFRPGKELMTGDAAYYRRLGELIARLHVDLAEFPVAGQRPGFGTTVELDAWVRPYDSASFEELAELLNAEDAELGAALRRERERSLRELQDAGYGSLPPLPVHGDFQDFNLLWTGDELTGLLDFDFARRDAQVCDLATMLVPFLPLDPNLAAALFAGYRTVRELSEAERAVTRLLPRALLLVWVALLLAGWRDDPASGLPGGVRRTLRRRLPAVAGAEDSWRQLLR